MMSLTRFYSHPPHMQAVLPFINGSSPISLRTIDWFVTNYARRHNLFIRMGDDSTPVNIYLNYRTQLKAYSKQQFDPFRRRDRITYYYDEHSSVETTIGQLNFFRWLDQTKILDYVIDHASEIEQDMYSNQPPVPATKTEATSTPAAAAAAAPTSAGHTKKPHTSVGIRRIALEHVVNFG